MQKLSRGKEYIGDERKPGLQKWPEIFRFEPNAQQPMYTMLVRPNGPARTADIKKKKNPGAASISFRLRLHIFLFRSYGAFVVDTVRPILRFETGFARLSETFLFFLDRC